MLNGRSDVTPHPPPSLLRRVAPAGRNTSAETTPRDVGTRVPTSGTGQDPSAKRLRTLSGPAMALQRAATEPAPIADACAPAAAAATATAAAAATAATAAATAPSAAAAAAAAATADPAVAALKRKASAEETPTETGATSGPPPVFAAAAADAGAAADAAAAAAATDETGAARTAMYDERLDLLDEDYNLDDYFKEYPADEGLECDEEGEEGSSEEEETANDSGDGEKGSAVDEKRLEKLDAAAVDQAAIRRKGCLGRALLRTAPMLALILKLLASTFTFLDLEFPGELTEGNVINADGGDLDNPALYKDHAVFLVGIPTTILNRLGNADLHLANPNDAFSAAQTVRFTQMLLLTM